MVIIIENSYIPNNFFDLVEYIEIKGFCTKPFCTTCGCMDLRKYLRENLGREYMIELIQNVSQNEITSYRIEDWRNILTIMTHELGIIFPRNNPLMQTYENYQYELYLLKEQRRDMKLKSILQEQVEAENRRVEKRKKYEAMKVKTSYERGKMLELFESYDLNSRLLMIANDDIHLPQYYPIDFGQISNAELRALPMSTILKLEESFRAYKKYGWKKFHQRLETILNSDE